MNETAREQEILTALRKIDGAATDEQKEQVRRLTGELYDQKDALDAIKEAEALYADQLKEDQKLIEENEQAMLKAAEATTAWSEAMGNAISRVDEAFVDMWKNIGAGFGSFADSLKEAFKQLLAELAHMAITRPILLNIAAGLGMGGASMTAAAADASAGAASIFGGISSLGGSIWDVITGTTSVSSVFSGGLQNLAGGFESMGWDMGAKWVTGYENALAMAGNGNVALGGLYTGAAGIAGGYVGNKAFGETTGIGSTVGTVAGTYVGSLFGMPTVGAGIGSFLGTGAERLLGNIFGFGGKGGNNAARGTFDLSTGEFSSAGIGKNFSERNLSTVQELIGAIESFSTLVGGSSLTGSIKVGNTSGFKMDGVRYADAEELLSVTFDKIIRNSEDLAGDLKKLILAFDGTAAETIKFAETMIAIDKVMVELKTPKYLRELIFAFEGTNEEIARFAGAIVALDEMMGMNPVRDATRDFAEAQESASTTMMDAYLKQGLELSRLIDEYDGSLKATEDLAAAMMESKDRAYDLALAIQQIGKSIEEITESSVDFYEQSTMTDKEKRAALVAERKEKLTELKTSLDPARILELVSDLNRINRDLYGQMSPEQQALKQQDFIDMSNYFQSVADRQLLEAKGAIEDTQEVLNAGVEKVLTDAAGGFDAAARSMGTAVDAFATVVSRLQKQGITVNVQYPKPEAERRLVLGNESVNI